MNNVLRALMADTDEERDAHLNRETLLYAVQRTIQCQRTGAILDVRTAVMVTTILGDKRGAWVLTGEAWDEMEEWTRAKAAEIGATLEVIDGRKL
ncbi:hypothetical protein GA0070606_5415 [Micromonospora citrea]|uniref:Uncharacterized protein n=1 Tax=Micromonospora citrea TaxID=47855 RepID=A0A1C6VW18_9ACTN|nr:hypothetical protein [Micromonospora citrea]SCL70485.1 hypothetical protein GA0070606_5415 [Micromonospora citrea]